MTNYKNVRPRVLQTPAYQHTLNVSDNPIALDGANATLGTTGITLHQSISNTDYQIPSDKYFHILGFWYVASASSRTIIIQESDSADADSNTADRITFKSLANDGIIVFYATHNGTPFQYSKYINIKSSNASANPKILAVVGYEYPTI